MAGVLFLAETWYLSAITKLARAVRWTDSEYFRPLFGDWNVYRKSNKSSQLNKNIKPSCNTKSHKSTSNSRPNEWYTHNWPCLSGSHSTLLTLNSYICIFVYYDNFPVIYFHKIRNVVVMIVWSWWQEDAESFSVTSHMLLSHQQKLPLSESELDYWDRERNTTLHITPRYNWARVTRNLTTDSRLRWLLPAQRLEFGRHKITRQII